MGGAAAHSTDATNFMFTPSATITADPPRVTVAQCDVINPSGLTQFCPPALQVPPPRLGQIDRPSPVPERVPMPSPTLRTLLLTDEGEGIEVVARMGQAVVPALVMLLVSDPDPAVRARAAGALGRIGGAAAAQALARVVRADGNPVVRLVAANLLPRVAGAGAEAVLLSALADPDAGVRIATLRSLAVIRTPAVRQAVARLATADPVPRVRQIAAAIQI